GEKTAAKLLAEYHTLEGVLENAANIKGKLGEKILMGKESAILSKKLATIIINVPIPYDINDLALRTPDEEKLNNVFGQLEFRTLAKRILGHTPNAVSVNDTATAAPSGQMDLFGNATAGSDLF